MTHTEWFIAENDPDDFPNIIDGPYMSYQDAFLRWNELSFAHDHVILSGDFPEEMEK